MKNPMKNETRGYFITFEGIEGAGKSTQARRLHEVLKGKGYPVVITREPGGTALGDAVRSIMIDTRFSDMVPLAELFLISAQRVQHIQKVIRPELEEGKIVICDRFVDATLAYQGYGREIHLTQVREVNEMAAWNLRPDLTFLLDIEPAHGLSRISSRVQENEKVADRMEREGLDFFERIRHGYLNIAYEEPQRFRKIDSTQDMDLVHHQILDCSLRELARHWGDPNRLAVQGLDL